MSEFFNKTQEQEEPGIPEENNEPSEVSEVPKRKRGRLPGYTRTQESRDKQKETRKRNKLLKESIEEPYNELENL